MSLTASGLVSHAKSKLGTPYVYGAKGTVLTEVQISTWAKMYPNIFTGGYISKARGFIGKSCLDCSGLISSYTGKLLGSAQLYSAASERIPISELGRVPVGAVLWKSGHVGIYIGDGMDIEAKGIKYGTVKQAVSKTKWQYVLLFSWMTYDVGTANVEADDSVDTDARINPYPEPTTTIKYGDKGDGVRWVQWELKESGYDLSKHGDIDGKFYEFTEGCVEAFQASCKIDADGKVGPTTRKYFKAAKAV